MRAASVREADLRSDRELIISFLRENLTPKSDDSRYDWLYLSNPAGPGRIWISWDESSTTPIALAAAIPRVINVKSRTQNAWILADFCVARSYRSLGPAIALQRACLETARNEKLFCCLDFPSKSMMSVYARLGIDAFAEFKRLAKPLRIDRKLASRVPSPIIGKPLITLGNVLLRLKDLPLAPRQDLEVVHHRGAFTAEFESLADRASRRYEAFSVRSMEHLNWRYVDHPFQSHVVLAARRNKELVGYAVISTGDAGEGVIQEILCLPEEDLWVSLALAGAGILRSFGSQSASLCRLGCDPESLWSRKAGFYPRESAPVIIYQPKGADSAASVPCRWFLMNGDRDS